MVTVGCCRSSYAAGGQCPVFLSGQEAKGVLLDTATSAYLLTSNSVVHGIEKWRTHFFLKYTLAGTKGFSL